MEMSITEAVSWLREELGIRVHESTLRLWCRLNKVPSQVKRIHGRYIRLVNIGELREYVESLEKDRVGAPLGTVR